MYVAERIHGPYMSHETGDKLSDVKRQPPTPHKLNIWTDRVDAPPQRPPMASCANHDVRYGELIAKSEPFVVMANVRKKESPTMIGNSTANDGRDNRNPFRNGDRYNNKCTK